MNLYSVFCGLLIIYCQNLSFISIQQALIYNPIILFASISSCIEGKCMFNCSTTTTTGVAVKKSNDRFTFELEIPLIQSDLDCVLMREEEEICLFIGTWPIKTYKVGLELCLSFTIVVPSQLNGRASDPCVKPWAVIGLDPPDIKWSIP